VSDFGSEFWSVYISVITVASILACAVLLWGLGLYGGYLLAYDSNAYWTALQTPAAFWIASTLALILTALIFWLLIWRITTPAKQHR